jgi:hypothetical protein
MLKHDARVGAVRKNQARHEFIPGPLRTGVESPLTKLLALGLSPPLPFFFPFSFSCKSFISTFFCFLKIKQNKINKTLQIQGLESLKLFYLIAK